MDIKKLEMSIYQNARDEDKLSLYDYYEIDVLDARLLKSGVDYICVPHQPETKMHIGLYDELVRLAQECDDIDDFVDRAFNSESWETYDVSKDDREDWLRQLFIAVHKTVPEIIKECKLSQGKLAKTFAIPKRTIENWCAVTPPQVYISLMMQECLGIFKRE